MRRSRRRCAAPCALVVLFVSLVLVGRAHGQYWEGQPFRSGDVTPLPQNLATGRDETTAFSRVQGASVVLRRFPHGTLPQLAALPIPLEASRGGTFAPLNHGGYVVAGFTADIDGEVHAQRANGNGTLIGDPILVASDVNLVGLSVAPIRDGFVVAWTDVMDPPRAQRLSHNGTGLGPQIAIGPASDGADPPNLLPLANGGFLAAWGVNPLRAHGFDADGEPLGPAFVAGSGFGGDPNVAVSADGTLAVAVGVDLGFPAEEVLARIFTPDGSSVSSEIVVATVAPGRTVVAPSVAFGANHDFVVVWGDTGVNQRGEVWAQAFDATGTPVRERRLLQASARIFQRTAVERRGDGGFMAFWSEIDDDVWNMGVRFTLCAPGSAVCGDGVEVSTCEACDDGPGNSDTAPDACRTDCREARCGDGVADTGEQCDDGNYRHCDGCTPFCTVEPGVVCGDGVVAPRGCNEHCDDANAVAGDGCANDCTLERIIGGGSALTDCWAAWRIENPSNVPLYDSRGRINRKQRCRDGDPACDFDAVAGQCTFRIAVCVNNSEPAGCDSERLLAWSVKKPSAKVAAGDPVVAALRSALHDAVLPNVVGAGIPNLCSPAADVSLPLKGGPGAYKASKLTLTGDGTSYDGLIDRDTLALRCDPAP